MVPTLGGCLSCLGKTTGLPGLGALAEGEEVEKKRSRAGWHRGKEQKHQCKGTRGPGVWPSCLVRSKAPKGRTGWQVSGTAAARGLLMAEQVQTRSVQRPRETGQEVNP